MCKMRNSAGLFMIMKPDNAVLLCARRAYDGAAVGDTFLEKISIPRGHRDCTDAKIYETAVREFVEETGRFFHSAYMYKFPFTLHWTDATITYKYSIYVGVVRGPLANVKFKPNTYSVKLLRSEEVGGNDYRIVLRPRRFNCEISRSLTIVPLDQYFEYMNSKQLNTYTASNYSEFFDFVRRVKRLFDNKQLDDFFHASLQRATPDDVVEQSRSPR
ncbi:nudix [Dione juno nucleopolyhedrovirus]|uniref:Nudix n=1 Tax=Dione juno nucleopolyhedrovirus TaxID=2594175 RepID=A0AAE6LC94_9ABAC|nr:nudix [Dione juno nucleopolyhedrovirus]QDL57070.1 nudix [Dione juno nucleopolyhedrovirus]